MSFGAFRVAGGAPHRSQIVEATVSSNKPAPTSFSDPLYVIPKWNAARATVWTITDWFAVNGATLPARGADCLVLLSDYRRLSVVWWDGTYSVPTLPGMLLAKVIYGAGGNYSPGTSLAALDATHLTASFTVPASGAVTVRLQASCACTASSNVNGLWFGCVAHNTSTQLGEPVQVLDGDFTTPDGFSRGLGLADIEITGLTPGASEQVDWAAKEVGGSATVYAGTLGATMKIFAA